MALFRKKLRKNDVEILLFRVLVVDFTKFREKKITKSFIYKLEELADTGYIWFGRGVFGFVGGEEECPSR